MESVGNRRRVGPVAFRRNLIVFFVIFGLINVILVVLYPQIYAGELFGRPNPTFSDILNDTRFSNLDKIKYRNRIFDVKNEGRTATNKASEFRLDEISNFDGSTRSKNLGKAASTLSDVLEISGNDNDLGIGNIPRDGVPSKTDSTFSSSNTKIIPSKSTARRNVYIPAKIEDTFKGLGEWFVYQNGRRKTPPQHISSSSASVTVGAMFSRKAKQSITEDMRMNPKTEISSKHTRPTHNQENVNTTKATTLNSTTPYQETLLKMTNSTKENALTEKNTEKLNPSMAATTFKSTTPFQQDSIEEPSCKPYELSAKSIEYTTKKYAIQPEIARCQDQTAPPNELCKVNETKRNDSYTNLEIKCDFSVCDKAKEMVIEYMSHENGLMKKYEIPKNSNNSEIEKLVLKFADDARKHDLPFVFVNCTGVNGAIIAQILTFLPSLPPLKDNEHQNKISINIFLVDSVSRPHFYRSFPKTVNYLKDIKNDRTYPANVFNFELFQAVHGHTNENERALFDGSLFPVRLGGKRRDNTAVNLDPLYRVFKTAGFQTMFLDDLCWRGHWGIMDKYKVGRWKSLQKKLRVSNIDTRGKGD
jgi:hypothetical protein